MKVRVLVVDDDNVIVFLHELMIRESGLSDKPVSFLNGQEALNYVLEDKSGEPILVFLDLNMPVMNGWEFMEALLQLERPEVKVVVVTSSIDEDDRRRSAAYPFVIGFVEKPLSADACRRIMNGLS